MKNMEDKQNFKNQIIRAIKLYNELYFEAFAKAQDGALISKGKIERSLEFLKEFKTRTTVCPDKQSVEIFTNSQTGEQFNFNYTNTESEEILIDNLMKLASFTSVIESAILSMQENTKAREVQGYCHGGAEIKSDNAKSIQESLNLLALIHEEYTRPVDKRKGQRSQSEIVETIIKRVLSESNRFEDIDFSNDSPAREYLDAMIEANESQIQIAKLKEVFTFRTGAVDILTELRQRFARQIFERERIIQSINKKNTIQFKADTNYSKTLQEIMEETSREVLSIAIGSGEAGTKQGKSIESLLSYKKQQTAEIKSAEESIKGVEKSFASLESVIARYDTRYNELLSQLPQRLQEIAETKGMDTVGGLMGKDIEAVECSKKQNAETGEWEIVDRKDIDKVLTDADVIGMMFNRTSHNSVVTYNLYDEISGADECADFEKILKKYEEKLKRAYNGLADDLEAIIGIYGDLLDYKMRICRIPYDSKRVVMRYLRDFNPIIAQTGMPYFTDDSLENIRENGRLSSIEAMDHQKLYYNHLAKIFGMGIVDYLSELQIRKEGQDVTELVNIDAISENITTIDLLGEEKSLKEIINDSDEMNKRLSRPDVCQEDLLTLLADVRMGEKLNGIIPYLGFEIGHSTLETLLKASYGKDKHPTKLITNLDTFDAVMKLEAISGQPFYQSNTFYNYLASNISKVEKYKRHHQARLREVLYEQLKVRGQADPRIQQLIDTFETYYIGWLHNLRVMEEERIEKNNPLITEGRDMEREARVLEKSGRYLNRFINGAESA